MKRFCECHHPDCHVCKICNAYEQENEKLKADNARLRGAISETKSLLAASMHEVRPASEYNDEIVALNEALFATASSAQNPTLTKRNVSAK